MDLLTRDIEDDIIFGEIARESEEHRVLVSLFLCKEIYRRMS